jgi:hypothetical protein
LDDLHASKVLLHLCIHEADRPPVGALSVANAYLEETRDTLGIGVSAVRALVQGSGTAMRRDVVDDSKARL